MGQSLSGHDLARQVQSFANRYHEEIYRDRDPRLRAQFEALNRALTGSESEADADAVALGWRNLFELVRTDSAADPAVVREVVQGVADHNGADPGFAYATAPVLLAERTSDYDDAIVLAQRGLDSVAVQMERDRIWFEDDSLFNAMLDEQRSVLVDAIGWVHHLANRPDSAEAILRRAHDLWPTNPTNLYHLGRFYEAAGNLDVAETFFRSGALSATPGDNPNRTALRALYQKTRGSLDGWEAYAKAFEEADRELRRSRILGTRPTPTRLPGFNLEQLTGGKFSSEALEGRVAVINFWGVWCAWCVREMPDVQALFERYADASDVAILTINNDANHNETRDWMAERGYDFPVLWDDGFIASDAGVTGFPTTWFIDPRGFIVYEQRGWTEKLLEEFSWRIEEIRNAQKQ